MAVQDDGLFKMVIRSNKKWKVYKSCMIELFSPCSSYLGAKPEVSQQKSLVYFHAFSYP